MSAVAHDPLIAEAKERARRRRLLALGVVAVLVAAAAAGTRYELRSSGNFRGVCATAPPGWRERTIPARGQRPGAVLLTNFRFGAMGPMQDIYGIDIPGRKWPPGGVMMAVQTFATRLPSTRAELQVRGADFQISPNGGSRRPTAFRSIRTNGRELIAYVQVASVTPATIAAANQALAGVRTCSA